MGRAEMRRAKREEAKKEKRYNLTQAQIEQIVQEALQEEIFKAKLKATEDATKLALEFMLTFPRRVLKDHYWKKTYKQRLPKFTDLVMEYYEKWQAGELDREELRAELEEEDGVRIEYREEK